MQLAIQHSAESDRELKQLLEDELSAAGGEYAEAIDGLVDEVSFEEFINRLKKCLDEENWADLASLMKNPAQR